MSSLTTLHLIVDKEGAWFSFTGKKNGASLEKNRGLGGTTAVQSKVLTNVNYPTINQMIAQGTMEEIKSITYQNNFFEKQQETIEISKKLIKESSWLMSKSFPKLSVEVKGVIAEAVSVSAGFSYTTDSQSTYSLEETDKRTETLTTTLTRNPI
ncbi:natterin [Labeo rohita]|uniref:Natterin n=1 Tax=Labeo rohita TaxID=84645 RepID=A0A498NW31_LABRO|nr:natterin [Labeo rohita]